jgi:5-methylcytosine-specific restriction endonuclease McrBC regulatory subunit McrC
MYLLGDGEASPELIDSLNRASDSDDFCDLVAELMISTTEAIIRSGIRREYVEFDRNSDFVRGQILIAEDLLENVPIRKGTVCRLTELTADIDVNKAILWGLEILNQGVSSSMARRMKMFSRRLEEISSPREVPAVEYHSESGRYRTALFLVNLVRRSLQTDAATFGLSGFGLMMDMNQVFEGYARNMLRAALCKHGLAVPERKSTKRSLCKGVMLEPDFVVSEKKSVIAVCDGKYKLDWRFQNADVYQMLAYLEGFGLKSAFIFHPESIGNVISVDQIDYPRSGTLFRVGLPTKYLLDVALWSEVARFMLTSLGAKAVVKTVTVENVRSNSSLLAV